MVHFIQQGFALIFRSFDTDRLERAVRVHRDGGVEEQVGVADLVHAAVREQTAHVLFQFLATFERVLDAPHQFFFFDRKGIGVLGIESRPVLSFNSYSFPSIRIVPRWRSIWWSNSGRPSRIPDGDG